MRLYAIKAKFTGLYEWGRGWNSNRIADTWYDYFRNLDNTARPAFWSYFERNNFAQTQYLVSTSGSVYLHPMDLLYVGHTNTMIMRMDKGGALKGTYPEIDELKEILIGAANACGGMVEFSDVSSGEIDVPCL